jgi:hypothetical protein
LSNDLEQLFHSLVDKIQLHARTGLHLATCSPGGASAGGGN